MPQLAFSFDQSACKLNGRFEEDITAGGLILQANGAVSCPKRQNNFPHALIGATLGNGSAQLETTTSVLPHMAAWTMGPAFKQLSVEMWITPQIKFASNAHYPLLEIGDEDDFQFRLYISGRDSIQVEYVYYASPSSTSTSTGLVHFASDCDDLASALTQFVSSGSSSPSEFFLGFTLDGSLANSFTNANLYLGARGAPRLSHCAAAGNAQGRQIRNFTISEESLLRIGGNGGFVGDVHFLALHARALAGEVMQNLFQRGGMPNSQPAPSELPMWCETAQSSRAQPLRIDAIEYFDLERDAIASYIITKLPERDKLLWDGVREITTLPFALGNLSQLAYQQTNAASFSQTAKNACLSEFDSFQFKLSDGLCEHCASASAGVVKICVRDVQDLPMGVPVLLPAHRLGASQVFELDAVDLDDGEVDNAGQASPHRLKTSANEFAPLARVRFNATLGRYGRIVHVLDDGTTCGSELVPVNTILPPRTYGNAQQQRFLFCYLGSKLEEEAEGGEELIGRDVFGFQFQDGSAELGPIAPISITLMNPLQACDVGNCSASGLENEYIPISLQGSDSIGNRTLEFHLVSLPRHGQLFENLANSSTNPVRVGAPLRIGSRIPANAANILYLGNPNFFSRHAGHAFVNIKGEAFNNCSFTTAPGCPDFFQYALSTSTQQLTSQTATFSIHVDSRVTPPVLLAPNHITASRNVITSIPGLDIIDFDQDVYLIGVKITLNAERAGALRIALPTEFYSARPKDITLDDCETSLELGVCRSISFYSHPSKARLALQAVQFHYYDALANDTQRITIRLYKPAPDGYPDALARFAFLDPVVTHSIAVYLGQDQAFATSLDGLTIGIIAGVCALILLALMFCILSCTYVADMPCIASRCKKKKEAAAAASSNSSSMDETSSLPPPNGSAGAGVLVTALADDKIFEWAKHVDERTGDEYYFNHSTGESTWDLPLVSVVIAQKQAQIAATTQKKKQPARVFRASSASKLV